LVDLGAYPEQGLDPLSSQHFELGKERDVPRIDGGDLELVPDKPEGQDVVLPCIGLRGWPSGLRSFFC